MKVGDESNFDVCIFIKPKLMYECTFLPAVKWGQGKAVLLIWFVSLLCVVFADVQHGFINLFTYTVDKLNDVVHRKIQKEWKF